MTFAYCPLDGRSGHEAGRALLAELYQAATGSDCLPPILKTERGKPYFSGSPLHFSISHTRHYAFCVLSEENVAIDAEELSRSVSLRLGEKILSPMEKAQFDAAPDKSRALLTFWVLKEAAAKLTGEGLRGYPNKTAFSLDDPRVQQIGPCLVAILTESDAAHPIFQRKEPFHAV